MLNFTTYPDELQYKTCSYLMNCSYFVSKLFQRNKQEDKLQKHSLASFAIKTYLIDNNEKSGHSKRCSNTNSVFEILSLKNCFENVWDFMLLLF